MFLGNFIINGIRFPAECLQEYNDLARKIYEINLKIKFGEQEPDKIENALADLRDRTYDSINEYLEAYEQDVYLERIAKRVTDINYPLNEYDEETLFINLNAEKIYLTLLKENGDTYVSMEIPRNDELIKNKHT